MRLVPQVNRAVGARVQSNGEAFAKFQELVTEPGFHALLEEARQDPKGPAARKVVSRVISFVNLVAGVVPWGSRERASEMTKLMAAHRYAGPASTYYSIAPEGRSQEACVQCVRRRGASAQ